MFTLYHADVTGNPGNCSYPHKVEVTDAASLQAAVCHDYVCAEYRNNYRNGTHYQLAKRQILQPFHHNSLPQIKIQRYLYRQVHL